MLLCIRLYMIFLRMHYFWYCVVVNVGAMAVVIRSWEDIIYIIDFIGLINDINFDFFF